MEKSEYRSLLEDYGKEYLDQSDYYEDRLYDLEYDEDILKGDKDLYWVACRMFYGGRWGYENDPFNPNDEWVVIDGYGNWESLNKYKLVDYLESVIDEDEFIEWCKEEGYLDEEDEDEDEEE